MPRLPATGKLLPDLAHAVKFFYHFFEGGSPFFGKPPDGRRANHVVVSIWDDSVTIVSGEEFIVKDLLKIMAPESAKPVGRYHGDCVG